MISETHLKDLADVVQQGLPGVYVHISRDSRTARAAKQMFTELQAVVPSPVRTTHSTRFYVTTETQRFIFAYATSTCCLVRGLSINRAYVDVPDERRDDVMIEVIPAIVAKQGKIL